MPEASPLARWQANRVRTARSQLDQFILRGRREIIRIEQQIAAAEAARKTLSSLEDFR